MKIAGIAAVVLLVTGLAAFFVPFGLLERALLFFSPDGDVQAKTVLLARNILRMAGRELLMAGALAMLYIVVGLFISRPGFSRKLSDPDRLAALPIRNSEIFFLGSILFVAVLIRWPFMSRSFYYDELLVWVHYIKPETWASFFDLWVANHIGCTLLGWVSFKLFGFSEWSLRLPSFLFGLGTIVLAWVGFRRHIGVLAAGAMAFLIAVSPVWAIFSTSVRGYAGGMFFAVVQILLYSRMIHAPSGWLAGAFILTGLCGILFHPFYAVLILAQLLTLPRGAVVLWKALGAQLLFILIIYLPRAMVLWMDLSGEKVRTPERLISLDVFRDFLGPTWPVMIGMLVMAGVGLWRMRRSHLQEAARAAFMLSIAAVLLPWFVAGDLLGARYWFVLLILLFLGASTGIAFVHEKASRYSRGLAVILLIMTAGLIGREWLITESRIVHDSTISFRQLAHLARQKASDDTAFFGLGHGAELFGHYADRPVAVVSTRMEYEAFLERYRRVACFVLPELEQVPAVEEILHEVQARGQVYRVRDLAVYFF